MDDDTLNGGAGHNTVNGGTGNDTYVFTLGAVYRYFDESGTDRVQIDSLTNLVRARQVGSDLVVQMTSGSFTVVNHFRGNPVENLVTPDGRSVVYSRCTISDRRSLRALPVNNAPGASSG